MENKDISRRGFLRVLGAAGLSLSGMPSFAGNIKKAVDAGSMTYRRNPVSGDKVSLLGYGCMRWPMIDNPDGSGGKIVDQEAVNGLVDHAMSKGVNYFDVSPVYLGGKAESAAGRALSRHPRSSYFLATKMSNHHLLKSGLKGEELYRASMDMYHRSFEALRTDHFDYYLVHNVGFEKRGLPFLKERVFDNGIIDFLVAERKAGHIRNIGFSFHGETREVFEFLMQKHDEVHWDFAQIKMNYFDYRHADAELSAKELYDSLTARGIPVIIMEPLLGGKLATLPNDIAQVSHP